MLKLASLIILALELAACSHYRQPKARCTGHLERINLAAPVDPTDAGPHRQDPPNEHPKDDGR